MKYMNDVWMMYKNYNNESFKFEAQEVGNVDVFGLLPNISYQKIILGLTSSILPVFIYIPQYLILNFFRLIKDTYNCYIQFRNEAEILE